MNLSLFLQLVLVGWFARWKVSSRTAVVLCAASRIRSKRYKAPFCCSSFFFDSVYMCVCVCVCVREREREREREKKIRGEYP